MGNAHENIVFDRPVRSIINYMYTPPTQTSEVCELYFGKSGGGGG